jgi:hypothetical protein
MKRQADRITDKQHAILKSLIDAPYQTNGYSTLHGSQGNPLWRLGLVDRMRYSEQERGFHRVWEWKYRVNEKGLATLDTAAAIRASRRGKR